MVVAGGFLIGFLWAVKKGQYEDHYSPSVRILFDDHEINEQENVDTPDRTSVEKEITVETHRRASDSDAKASDKNDHTRESDNHTPNNDIS